MNSRRDPSGSSLPALVPMHGNHEKRPRLFDRDVATIGRARGTDICLDAAEISTLHCVIYRTALGLRIRDCGSRTGTRVNGANVKNQPLQDGDILQLGPFSFEVKIPAELAAKRVTVHDPVQLNRLQVSRMHLAQIALRLRRKLHNSGDAAVSEEMNRKAQVLRDKIKNYDQRLIDLEEAEKELDQERRVLAKEREDHHKHVQKIEKDLSERLKAADAEIRERWQSFQMRCQVEESRHLQELECRSKAMGTDSGGELLKDLEAKTKIITDQATEIARRTEQLRSEQLEFQQLKQHWESERGQMSAKLEEQRAAAGSKDAQLKAQRSELTRMMTELKRMQEDFRRSQKIDVQEVLLENETLRERLQEIEQRAQERPSEPDENVQKLIQELRAENAELHRLLCEKSSQPVNDALSQEELQRLFAREEQLRAENDLLKQMLQEKATEMELAPRQENDLESYETELNEFRRQLEVDRSKMVKEIEQLRLRNEDLDEARREMEMELSRERAELSRERIRLDRMRDEVKADMDRMQRELSVRDSMAQVQKLRDEINQKKQPPGAVTGQLDKKLSERLRNIRGNVADTPS
jgi:pSer/pThr/pTyr-binding forkhead associated (FHA) protein